MSQEPTYPADAVPGRAAPPAAAPAAPKPADVAKPEAADLPDSATSWKKAADAVSARPGLAAGVAIGIGSAAVAAALLYANRTRKG